MDPPNRYEGDCGHRAHDSAAGPRCRDAEPHGSSPPVPLDSPITGDVVFGEVVPDSDTLSPEAALLKQDERHHATLARASRTARECEILELVPDQRFSYQQAAGPLSSHEGVVNLTRAPHGGTEITWSATYRHALPLLDTLRRRRLQVLAHDLASYANSVVSRHS